MISHPILPQVSRRGHLMPASPIRNLMPLANRARQRGVHVYHLNIGQPDIETPETMRQRLGTLSAKVLAYSPSHGTPEFLSSMRAYYAALGVPITDNEIIATTGGSEALMFAMMACASDGDEALVLEPFYTNYRAFATMAGIRLVPILTRGEDGFHLPKRHVLDAAVTDRTRFVILCNPNNPTGTVYHLEELEMIVQFCRDRGLFLISDEVYREFVYDGRRAISVLELEGFAENVIVADSLSKRYSACGIRLGCLITRNRDLFQACSRMAQGRLSPPGLAQWIATGIHQLGPEYTRDVVIEYQRRRDVLFHGLGQIPGVFLRKPEGAFYLVTRLPVDDTDDFAKWMLESFQHQGATVMVAPARGFYATPGLGHNEVRIAYVLKEDDLRSAIEILAAGLSAYQAARGLDQDKLDDAVGG